MCTQPGVMHTCRAALSNILKNLPVKLCHVKFPSEIKCQCRIEKYVQIWKDTVRIAYFACCLFCCRLAILPWRHCSL